MPIKNYTTKIDSHKSIAQIEEILSRAGVNRIVKEYDGDGVAAVTFCVGTQAGDLAFRLPLRAASILSLMESLCAHLGAVVPFWGKSETHTAISWNVRTSR